MTYQYLCLIKTSPLQSPENLCFWSSSWKHEKYICHVLVHTQKYHEIKKVILTTVHYNTNSLFWPEIIPFHPQILFSLRNTSQYFLTKIDHFQSDQKSTNLDGWVPVIDTQHSNTDKIQHKKWFSTVVNLTMKRGDKIFIFRVEGISHSCIMHTA